MLKNIKPRRNVYICPHLPLIMVNSETKVVIAIVIVILLVLAGIVYYNVKVDNSDNNSPVTGNAIALSEQLDEIYREPSIANQQEPTPNN